MNWIYNKLQFVNEKYCNSIGWNLLVFLRKIFKVEKNQNSLISIIDILGKKKKKKKTYNPPISNKIELPDLSYWYIKINK